MKEWIDYFCLLIEKKYHLEIKSGIICTYERGNLPCICVSGEMLNQMICAMLQFIENEEYSVEIRFHNNSFFPVAMKDETLYISIDYNQVCCFRVEDIERKQCIDKFRKEFYIKLKHHNKVTDEEEYKKLLTRKWNQITTEYQFKRSSSRKTQMLILYILTKFYIHEREHLEQKHLAIWELRFFLSPWEMHNFFVDILKRIDLSQNKATYILIFMEKHINFLFALNEVISGREFRIDKFTALFLQHWELDILRMVEEYLNNANVKYETLVEMLSESYETGIKVFATRAFEEELEIIAKFIDENGLCKIMHCRQKIDQLIAQNKNFRNRNLGEYFGVKHE